MPGRPSARVCLLHLIGLCFLLAPLRIVAQSSKPDLAAIPLAFERNQGQAPAQYQFLARRGSMQAFFSTDGVDVVIGQPRKSAPVAHITWVGAQDSTNLTGDDALPGHSNYLRGTDPAKWLKNVPQFASVRYANLYPNIDLVFHGYASSLEHDFLVQPGGDVTRIALKSNRPAHIDRSGNLLLDLGQSQLTLLRPVAYQLAADGKKQIPANFIVASNGQIHFKVANYDHSKPLIIDPVFVFSTYLDGSLRDYITSVTTDPNGNVYVTGNTASTDFPITNSASPLCPNCSNPGQLLEGFISKLDPTGHTLLFSTYLGGSYGGGFGTGPASVVLDKNQNIYVGGVTSSWDFPHAGSVLTLTPQNYNANYYFVSCLKPDGSAFIYSGLVGGMEGISTDNSNGVLAVDANSNAYYAGNMDDINFQLTPGTYSTTPVGYPNNALFVLKLDPTGKLVQSTLVPGNVTPPAGSNYAGNFIPHGIAVGANGQVTLAGIGGTGLPTTPGVLQPTFTPPPNYIDPPAAFLLQLNATFSALNFATYLPGADNARAMTVDPLGNFYMVGYTTQTTIPVSANAYQKQVAANSSSGYILKVDSQAKTVLAATYLSGPTSYSSFNAVALDSKGNVVVGGTAGSQDFPLKNPFQPTYELSGTAPDLVIAELTPDLSSLTFATFLSGATFPYPGSLLADMVVDSTDKIVLVGTTNATDFPTTPGSYQAALPPQSPSGGGPHSFISKLDLATPAPSVCLSTSGSLNLGTVLYNTSATQTVALTNCGNAVLQVTAVASTLASVVPTQNCASVAIGATCNVQITFTPVDGSNVQGTVTLTDNAATSQQFIPFYGQGGVPDIIDFPSSFAASDLVVGTHAEFSIPFLNLGNGAWIVSSVTATGDFSVDQSNQCAASALPGSVCTIGIVFTPTLLGVRTGTLTITDNAPGSPHVIALSGNALSAYTTPSIRGITAIAADAMSPYLEIVGNNFFPASQVLVNGSPRTTTYYSDNYIYAVPAAGDLAQAGELSVTITNPTPGGGTSNSYPAPVYTALRNIYFEHAVYDSKAGHIYASVSTSSPNYPNQVLVIDPASAKVLSAWTIGNGPNQLAISDDQQFLYVGLDGDAKVAQVAIPAGTVNFAVALGTDLSLQVPYTADAISVFPGKPHTWAVSFCITGNSCGGGPAIFDDAVERPTLVSDPLVQPGPLLFLGQDSTTLYGADLSMSSPAFYQFAITSAGISTTQSVNTGDIAAPGSLDTNGTYIYVSNGEVIDPATLTLKSASFPAPLYTYGMRVDVLSSRIYFYSNPGFGPFANSVGDIQAYDLASQQLTGSIGLGIQEQGVYGLVGPEMYRFGTNGLEVGIGGAMLFFRTSLTNSTPPPTQFFVSSVMPEVIPAGSPDQNITILGSGFATGDVVTANGIPLATSNISNIQIPATIPAALLSAAGDLQLTIADANNHVAYLQVVVSEGPSTVALSTNVLNFAAQNVHTNSTAQTITLSNTGTSTLTVSNVSATGDFSLSNTCSTVAASGTCTISVTFTPSTAGTRSGTVVITDSDVTKSQTVTLNGIGSDVQIAAGGSGSGGATQTVKTGSPASYPLTITPQSGFTGPLTFACANLPQYATCSFTPANATLGNAPVNVTVTIATQQQQTGQLQRIPGTSQLAAFFACLLLLPLGFGKRRKLLRKHLLLAVLLVALVLLPLSGCGGGGGGSSGSSNPPPPVTQTTPAGTYTVTFTVSSGSFSHSAPLTLVVTN